MVLHLSYSSVCGVFFLAYLINFCIKNMCHIFMFISFYICFLINPSARPIHVLIKPILIDLGSIVVVGLNSAAWKYCDNYSLVVWSRILFSTVFDCCVTRGASHIPVCLFLVSFHIFCPLFWTVSPCWYSIMMHP